MVRIRESCKLNDSIFGKAEDGLFFNLFKILSDRIIVSDSVWDSYSYYGWLYNDNKILSVQLGFQLNEKPKLKFMRNSQFRLGIRYFSRSVLNSYISENIIKRYDTLISSVTGKTV
jgi:hypothetical protein